MSNTHILTSLYHPISFVWFQVFILNIEPEYAILMHGHSDNFQVEFGSGDIFDARNEVRIYKVTVLINRGIIIESAYYRFLYVKSVIVIADMKTILEITSLKKLANVYSMISVWLCLKSNVCDFEDSCCSATPKCLICVFHTTFVCTSNVLFSNFQTEFIHITDVPSELRGSGFILSATVLSNNASWKNEEFTTFVIPGSISLLLR